MFRLSMISKDGDEMRDFNDCSSVIIESIHGEYNWRINRYKQKTLFIPISDFSVFSVLNSLNKEEN